MLRDQGRPKLIGESGAMKPVLELIARVGPSDANVHVRRTWHRKGGGGPVPPRSLDSLRQANGHR